MTSRAKDILSSMGDDEKNIGDGGGGEMNGTKAAHASPDMVDEAEVSRCLSASWTRDASCPLERAQRPLEALRVGWDDASSRQRRYGMQEPGDICLDLGPKGGHARCANHILPAPSVLFPSNDPVHVVPRMSCHAYGS